MNKLESISVYGALTKADQQDDGTLRIEGIASSEVVDSAGEIVLAAAMRDAVAGFMNNGKGSLRLMHRSDVAAGTVDEVTINDATGETKVKCTVVDREVCRLVLTKTLRGMSIGGKVLARDPKDRSVITRVDWRELSLCDRPANPSCSMTIAKTVTAAPLGQQPIPGGTDDMAPVKSLGSLTQEQVAQYLAGLSQESRAELLIGVIMRKKIGRRM